MTISSSFCSYELQFEKQFVLSSFHKLIFCQISFQSSKSKRRAQGLSVSQTQFNLQLKLRKPQTSVLNIFSPILIIYFSKCLFFLSSPSPSGLQRAEYFYVTKFRILSTFSTIKYQGQLHAFGKICIDTVNTVQ